MQDNTVLVITKETARRAYRTEPIYQYDVGHKLQLAGFDGLPDVFQVHFAHSPMGDSITQIGQDGVVDVPDMYAQTAAPIYAWVYVAEAESGLTKYQIEIPVQRRARITDQEPTPVEQSAIDQAIAALNAGVDAAEDAQAAAEVAQAAAELAKSVAELEADAAEAAKLAAQGFASAADGSATAAEQARDAAETALDDALEEAEGYVSQAQAQATAAAGSASAAGQSATAASGSAIAAAESAAEAEQIKDDFDSEVEQLESDVSDLKSALNLKITEPETDGTDGQVLATNGQGGRYWKTVSEGGGQTDIGLSVVNGIICITYEEAV